MAKNIDEITPDEIEALYDEHEARMLDERTRIENALIKDEIKPKHQRKNKDGDLSTKQEYEDFIDRMMKETNDRIQLALANIREAMIMLSEGDIKSELRSAEHHLTREV